MLVHLLSEGATLISVKLLMLRLCSYLTTPLLSENSKFRSTINLSGCRPSFTTNLQCGHVCINKFVHSEPGRNGRCSNLECIWSNLLKRPQERPYYVYVLHKVFSLVMIYPSGDLPNSQFFKDGCVELFIFTILLAKKIFSLKTKLLIPAFHSSPVNSDTPFSG